MEDKEFDRLLNQKLLWDTSGEDADAAWSKMRASVEHFNREHSIWKRLKTSLKGKGAIIVAAIIGALIATIALNLQKNSSTKEIKEKSRANEAVPVEKATLPQDTLKEATENLRSKVSTKRNNKVEKALPEEPIESAFKVIVADSITRNVDVSNTADSFPKKTVGPPNRLDTARKKKKVILW
ncbi:MAG: hypothetical protein MRY83_11125 [Flavobacteriales bacterium]|nr:hypothetical protein [Flavobacteriales bacterium]